MSDTAIMRRVMRTKFSATPMLAITTMPPLWLIPLAMVCPILTLFMTA